MWYLKPLAQGIGTYIPGLARLFPKKRRGAFSARYCYSVWLRHLVIAHKNGLGVEPDTIAELGPGDSLGVGLAGMLSGANRYYAFDAVKSVKNEKNIEILGELADLFSKQEAIPDNIEFPEVKPYLDSYAFPAHILTTERLKKTLNPARIDKIKNALLNLEEADKKDDMQILYFAPWCDKAVVKKGALDMVFSQAVLEHIEDVAYAYRAMYDWLKRNGVMSHQIDFRSHGLAKEWNGHWAYSDLVWRLIKAKRPFLLNRHPHSLHLQLMRDCGFKIACDIKIKNVSRLDRKKIAPRFKDISDDELETSGAFIQAVKI